MGTKVQIEALLALGLLELCGFLSACGGGSSASTTSMISVSPSSLSFGNQTVGTTSAPKSLTITNTGNATLNISSVRVIPQEFQLASGDRQQSLAPGASATYSATFTPDSAKSFSGQLNFNSDVSTSPTMVSLSGTGLSTGTVPPGVSPPSIPFGNQTEGTTSSPQTVTITDGGSTTFTVTAVTTSAPFAVSGFAVPARVAAGKAFTFQLTISPTATGNFTSTVTIAYDLFPSSGVSLSGTGTASTALAITRPSATQGAAYLAFLQAVGGTAPYSWAVAPSSSLPANLSLASSTGIVSGILSSTAPIGSVTLTVQVTDSVGGTANATLLVNPSSRCHHRCQCNNIFVDIGNLVPGSNSLGPYVIPIIDMGATNTYFGAVGGLYGDVSGAGSNTRPAAYDSLGVTIANSVVPLDSSGNPDPATGKIVPLSVSMSNTKDEFAEFITVGNADPSENPHVVLVNGAQGGQTAKIISDPTATFWSKSTPSCPRPASPPTKSWSPGSRRPTHAREARSRAT